MKPKIFFDTQVVSMLAQSETEMHKRVWRKVRNQYRYLISPLTMFELFFGLAGADEKHFHVHHARFQTLRGTGQPTILALPERFAIKRALEIDIGQDFHTPQECARYISLVLKARSRSEIEIGKVILSPLQRKRGTGMLLDDMRDSRLAIVKDHVELLQRVRSGEQPIPSPMDWSKSVLYKSGAPVTDSGAAKFLDAADAVYHYDNWLWEHSGAYRFDRSDREGDLMDSQQLYYLADPDIVFLTADRRIKERIASSTKSSQVLLYKNFMTDLSFHVD
jgi:hypothetical protein